MNKKWSLVAAGAVMMLGLTVAPQASMAATTANYAIFGDSIAFGVGATNWYGYSQQYKDFLTTKYSTVSTKNSAVPGITSTQMLNSMKTSLQTGILTSANETVISIGGNNLLGCASNNYSTIDTVCAENGVQTFAADWPQIMNHIRNTSHSATKLYVMSLYNPYRGDEALYSVVDPYIQRINAIINNPSTASAYNYRVVDMYNDFYGKDTDGQWKVAKYTHFQESTRDPHPNDAGHKEIEHQHELKF